MKYTNNFILALAICLIALLSCCNKKQYSGEEAYELASIEIEQNAPNSADQALEAVYEKVKSETSESDIVKFTPSQIIPNFIATQAALASSNDGVHKFIRTAHIKFKVIDIPQATRAIEDIIIKNRGFIIKSEIKNENGASRTINISKDSICVIHNNNLTANLELRVHNLILDSTLRQIAPWAILTDYRIVEAKDVTAQLMADKLKQVRLDKKQRRVSSAIDTRGRSKLEDVVSAEEALDGALEDADRTKISEYTMNDQIAYSNIYINLYQDPTEYIEKAPSITQLIREYQPGFGAKVLDAMSSGWFIFSRVLIFLINIWPFLLIATMVFGVYIYMKRKKNQQ